MRQLERIEFQKGRSFRFIRERGRGLFFVNDLEERVLTDQVGQAVWEALPGTGARICERVRKKISASKRLVYEFLYVLACARIIQADPPFHENQRLKSKEALAEQEAEDLVSIIIVTHNGEDYIKPCLKSVMKQTYGNLEVICVDNHSTDKTAALIKENFPQVRITALKRNYHYAKGINKGLRQARGRYFFILNQDTELDKDCVKHLVKKARFVTEAGAVAAQMRFARMRDFINGIGNQVNNRSWGTDNFIYCVDIGQFKDLKEVPSACFGAVLLKREALDEAGPVDAGYGSYYEDADWSLRCWFRGWKIVPEPGAVVYHKFGASYQEEKKLFFTVRNRLRMVLKLFQGRVKLGFLKNYMREDLRCVLSFVKKGDLRKIWIYMKAYLSLSFHLPEIAVKRRRVMRTKVKGMRERKVLEKNPSFYCCLHPALRMPEIDTAVMRRYYRWHLLKLETK